MPRRLCSLVLGLAASTLPMTTMAQEGAAVAGSAAVSLDELVVTATGRPEPRSEIAGTVQVIDRTMIENSTAK